MGRTVSPISGVLIAVSQLAGVSSMDLVKRNFIPFSFNMILLLILHFIL
jgi:DcuC family C4-dicarboxylate transporter